MSIDSEQLLNLLPAIHRIRDAEIAQKNGLDNGPLEDLMAVIAEQLALMEENIQQSYDDLFIETCSDWVTPYIGDVIGYQTLHGNIPDVASPRAEVAHTIALRRRKGTAVVLEQLARDVTGWNARAVEFFKQLGWTQYSNHNRNNVFYSPDLRDIEPLSRIGSAFNTVQHTVDVRRAESNRGRFNIPNVGIFLWRLEAYPHTLIPAQRVAERRYLMSPLGHPLALFSRPRTEEGGFITELANPTHIPEPLARRQLHDHLEDYYGRRATAASPIDNDQPSILLHVNDIEIPRDQVWSCDLSDDGASWAHQPPNGIYAIDPVLGRLALPPDVSDSNADPASVSVSYHHGFSAEMGGGEYERESSFALTDGVLTIQVPTPQHPTIQTALDALGGVGVVEIINNDRFEETLTVDVAENASIELRAANERNPHLALTGPLTISGLEGSVFSINGCLISGEGLTIPNTANNQLSQLDICHCTFVPGHALDPDGKPTLPGAVSITVSLSSVTTTIDRSITGSLRMVPESNVILMDSIIDANDSTSVAFADLDDNSAGAALKADACTVIGKVHAREFGTVSNCIFIARLAPVDSWNAPVWTLRKQTGCVRFSFLPINSIVPRRYRCQPDSEDSARRISARFSSLNYGEAAYGQLLLSSGDEVWRGADDESEMGAFHHLYAPLRDRNLRIRLREYLRVGLQAGLFYES
ncbi:MAG: hypothetical protein COB51_12555 [Moraxellaceae bacterium]|nr:MAG: hypothetical protein COB51_12555 [Moraxellaceae bacterium]